MSEEPKKCSYCGEPLPGRGFTSCADAVVCRSRLYIRKQEELHRAYRRTTHRQDEVVEMHLCEVNYLILKPDQLYRFKYDPACGKCKQYVEGGS